MTTLCIDGYNIAMARGTGIATYGRSLLDAAATAGIRSEIIFGPPARRAAANVVNEANLVGALSPTPRSLVQKAQRRLEAQIGAFSVRAWPVEISGEVLWPEARGGMPNAAAFWAVDNLFHRSARSFRRQGRLLPLTFDTKSGRAQPDIMHWTTPLAVHARGLTNVYTIHDLIPLKAPHTTIHDREAFMALHAAVARKADHVVVVSEATRRDVISLLGLPEDRVTNTYQSFSIPETYACKSDDQVGREIEQMFDLGWKDYFIHFGAIEPKKNLGRIVEAYLGSRSPRPLVVVGGRGWLQEDETALIKQVQASGGAAADRIRVYDYMSQSNLINLIRGSRALLFPSLYEGFGLPVLEAMALRTAVLTSTAGALPEVAGDAALMVDPQDVDALRRGIEALDDDDGLVDDLVKRGLSQSLRFGPAAYAERIGGLYAKLR